MTLEEFARACRELDIQFRALPGGWDMYIPHLIRDGAGREPMHALYFARHHRKLSNGFEYSQQLGMTSADYLTLVHASSNFYHPMRGWLDLALNVRY
jgi:hypothetical protein